MTLNTASLKNHSRRERFSVIASLALAVTQAGYDVVSYIPGVLGIDSSSSRVVTVPYRALVLLLLLYALIQILFSRMLRARFSVTSVLVVFFWTAYCLRFIVDAVIKQIPLGKPPEEMALLLFGTCVPTFIVFYLIGDAKLYGKALVWGMLALGACCAAYSVTQKASDTVQQGAGNELMNHITSGHMGLTAMILGLFVLLQPGRVKRPFYIRAVALGVVMLGTYVLLVAMSRGAIVAAVLLVPLLIYMGLRRGSKIVTIGVLALIAAVLVVSVWVLTQKGVDLQQSVASVSAYSEANGSVNERQTMYKDAWGQYLANPVLGSSIVERHSLFYPHNAILESFMATGTFGGAAFTLLVLIATYRAVKMMRIDSDLAWLPLCFFQQLIGAMFSGGLYQASALWGMMAIMLGAELPRRMQKQTRETRKLISAPCESGG